jgi:hypothetical protein
MEMTTNAEMTKNDVFRKIKEISVRTLKPRPSILINNLSHELNTDQGIVMSHLLELKDLRLITIDDKDATSINLTLLGSTVKR